MPDPGRPQAQDLRGEASARVDRGSVCVNPDRFLDVATGPPDVRIIASHRVVAPGEAFDIAVFGTSPIGLAAIWWFGQGTGDANHDKAHWEDAGGLATAMRRWTGVVLSQPGTYHFGANARDVLYGVQLGVPHQASEGAGIATCTVEVRADMSYDAQVDRIKAQTGRPDAWEQWMKSADVRARYEPVWNRSRAWPTTTRAAFAYGGAPVAYSPAWPSEAAHMAALDQLAELVFPPIGSWTVFGADPAASDVAIVVRGAGATSQAFPGDTPPRVYLYFEPILGHEFGHVLLVPHHYIGSDAANPVFLPPGETQCVMARNASMYCSGCRTAMHLDPYVDNTAAFTAIASDLNARYP